MKKEVETTASARREEVQLALAETLKLRKELQASASLKEEMELYKEQLLWAQSENAAMKTLLPERPLVGRFSISQIANDDALVRFYTGLPDFEHFQKLAAFLKDCSETMPLWRGSGHNDSVQHSQGRH